MLRFEKIIFRFRSELVAKALCEGNRFFLWRFVCYDWFGGFFKDFSAPYVDEKNDEKIVTYTMHVRDLEKSNSCHVDPRFIKALADNKAYSKYKIFDTNFTIVEMKLAGDLIENEIKLNKSFLIYNIIK